MFSICFLRYYLEHSLCVSTTFTGDELPTNRIFADLTTYYCNGYGSGRLLNDFYTILYNIYKCIKCEGGDFIRRSMRSVYIQYTCYYILLYIYIILARKRERLLLVKSAAMANFPLAKLLLTFR